MNDLNVNPAKSRTAMGILLALSFAHFSNDVFQSIVPSIFPMLENSLSLNLAEIGIIALVYQIFSSIFQPIVGVIFDKKPRPYYLPIGMMFTLVGLAILAFSPNYISVLISVALIGTGSSIIHPEASRLTHLASGGRHGLAQSIFQVGGNLGGSLGPLLAALIITPYGQEYIVLFSFLALIVIVLLSPIYKWYGKKLKEVKEKKVVIEHIKPNPLNRQKTTFAIVVLLILLFSKYVYMASLTNYYTFFLIDKFGVTTQESQMYLFLFLFSVALGTLIGGPIGDRIGRKYVIWVSILGAAPFALFMPHVGLMGTCILTTIVGVVLASAFSAILVYAQELLPSKLGLVSGMFFGFAFGIAGISAALLGWVADSHGIQFVYDMCAYMPLLGIVALFLPNVKIKHN
ncbi:MFS transporter [Bacteroides propionicifaciens]|uniref:MFS transporter n=1 Tax=Bacteroides propionicifaciens TaxID=392838 RepID=UPI0003681BB8|nr:MFS transporter [Bacteroides propionicifaciens]